VELQATLWHPIGHASTHVVLAGQAATLCGQEIDDDWRPWRGVDVRCVNCGDKALALIGRKRPIATD
jgi:hypothetical protein